MTNIHDFSRDTARVVRDSVVPLGLAALMTFGLGAVVLGFTATPASACVGSECSSGVATGGHDSTSLPGVRFDRVIGAGIEAKFDVRQEGAALGLTDGVGETQHGASETYSRMTDFNRSKFTASGSACEVDCESFEFGVEFGVDNENGAFAAHRAESGSGVTESFSAASTQQWSGFGGMMKFGIGGND